VISQVIDPVMDSAWTTACMPLHLPRQTAGNTINTPIGYTTSLNGRWLPGSAAFGSTTDVDPYPVRLGSRCP
jgi:hypothetical protein